MRKFLFVDTNDCPSIYFLLKAIWTSWMIHHRMDSHLVAI